MKLFNMNWKKNETGDFCCCWLFKLKWCSHHGRHNYTDYIRWVDIIVDVDASVGWSFCSAVVARRLWVYYHYVLLLPLLLLLNDYAWFYFFGVSVCVCERSSMGVGLEVEYRWNWKWQCALTAVELTEGAREEEKKNFNEMKYKRK